MADTPDYRVRDPDGVIPRKDIKFYALQNDLTIAEALAKLVSVALETGADGKKHLFPESKPHHDIYCWCMKKSK